MRAIVVVEQQCLWLLSFGFRCVCVVWRQQGCVPWLTMPCTDKHTVSQVCVGITYDGQLVCDRSGCADKLPTLVVYWSNEIQQAKTV